jgi:Tat protein translocase TatB subunit
MPSIGPAEILMVAAIGLIVFGPQRLPEIARTVGKALAEFKRQASDIRQEFETGLNDPEDEKPAPADQKPAPEEDPPAAVDG